jgi:hypothetical protein
LIGCVVVSNIHTFTVYDQNTELRNKDKQGQRNTEEEFFYFEGCTSSTVECFLLLCLFVG